MGKDGTWVDHIFIQITAYFMALDIKILTTTSRPESPFIIIEGSMIDDNGNSSGPPLHLGNYTNIHYQSVIEVKEGKISV